MKLYAKARKFQAHIVSVGVYGVYLLVLPSIVRLYVGCLDKFSNVAYEFEDCTIMLAIDKFLMFALGGFVILILSLFFWERRRRVAVLVITAGIMAAMTIVAFYIYVPFVQRNIIETKIYLDSV